MRFYLQYKERIKKLQGVADTIKTIEKISAARLKPLKDAYENMLNYNQILSSTLYQTASVVSQKNNYDYPKKKKEKLLIVVTGNKGLVGNLYRKTVLEAEKASEGKKIIAIGKKSAQISGNKIFRENMPDKEEDVLSINKKVSETVLKFLAGGIESVEISYPSFISFVSQKPEFLKIYPVDLDNIKSSLNEAGELSPLTIFEPDGKDIIKVLTKIYIDSWIAKAINEARLSEVASRLLESQKASDKAGDLIKQAKHMALKARRRESTAEQLESFIGHVDVGRIS